MTGKSGSELAFFCMLACSNVHYGLYFIKKNKGESRDIIVL